MNEEVFIVTEEPYHDNSSILGAYSTIELAMQSLPHESWETIGFYAGGVERNGHEGWPFVVAEQSVKEGQDVKYLIHKLSVQQ